MKDLTQVKSNVVYKFIFPGCKATYLGKTEKNLYQIFYEHATSKASAFHTHMKDCPEIQYLNYSTIRVDKFNFCEININTVNNKTIIIDFNDNRWTLLITEAVSVKRIKKILE